MADKDVTKTEARELKDAQLDDVQGGILLFDEADAVRAGKGPRGAKSGGVRSDKTEGLKADGGPDGELKQTGDKIVATGGGSGI